MLRKFPPQTGFTKPNNQMNPGMQQQMMPQMMQGMQGFPQQQFPQQMQGNMQPQPQLADITKMETADKREYLGEILFGRITQNPNFASITEYI